MDPDRDVVVIVGSLHYDIFVEAPHRPAAGETVTGFRWYPKPGGKGGNQAVALARHGVKARMVSAVGGDDFADFLLESLEDAGVETTHVQRLPSVGTGMSVAISDAGGDYGAVIVSGANLGIAVEALDRPDVWDGVGVLLLQNEVPEEINVAAAHRARSRGATVCLNAAPARAIGADLLGCVDILVVNALEARALCGVEVADLDTAEKAAVDLARRVPCAIVTAGGDGVACASEAGRDRVPAEQVEVASTHGAGDHFIGAFIAALALGDDRGAALRGAVAAAGRFVAGQ